MGVERRIRTDDNNRNVPIINPDRSPKIHRLMLSGSALATSRLKVVGPIAKRPIPRQTMPPTMQAFLMPRAARFGQAKCSEDSIPLEMMYSCKNNSAYGDSS